MSEPLFKHKRVAIDFDGTLFEDVDDVEKSWKEYQKLSPIPGAAETTKWLISEGWEVLIFTCRPDYHRRYLEDMLNDNGYSYDYILFYTKPRVDLYIDDKALTFSGDWGFIREWVTKMQGGVSHNAMQPESIWETIMRKQRIESLEFGVDEYVLDVGCADGSLWDVVDTSSVELYLYGVEPDAKLRRGAFASGHYVDVTGKMPVGGKWDKVLVLGVLEHVDNVGEFLQDLPKADTILFTVPNGNSVHRFMGVHMGIIEEPTSLDKQDLAVDHKRVYTIGTLLNDLNKYLGDDYDVDEWGSHGFKIGTSLDMAAWKGREDSLHYALKEAGIIGPETEHGAELYVVLRKTPF